MVDWGNGVVKVTVGDSMVSESKLVALVSRLSMSTLEDLCCSSMIVCSYLWFVFLFNAVLISARRTLLTSLVRRVESRYRSVGVLVPVFDDEISNSKAIFWYEGTEIG